MLAILLAAVSLGPSLADCVTVDRVAVVELNHYYDGCGNPSFTQFIFRDWLPGERTHRVVAWRLANSPWQLCGRSAIVLVDGDRLRRVEFGAWRRTWTQFDGEIDERAVYGLRERRELFRP